jgi:hypothetical protein
MDEYANWSTERTAKVGRVVVGSSARSGRRKGVEQRRGRCGAFWATRWA